MLTAGRDHAIKVWDLQTGECLQSLRHYDMLGSITGSFMYSDIQMTPDFVFSAYNLWRLFPKDSGADDGDDGADDGADDPFGLRPTTLPLLVYRV